MRAPRIGGETLPAMPAGRLPCLDGEAVTEPSANVETDPALPPAPMKEAAWSCAPATSAVPCGTRSRSAASAETVPIGAAATHSENGTSVNQGASTAAAATISADQVAASTSKRPVRAAKVQSIAGAAPQRAVTKSLRAR